MKCSKCGQDFDPAPYDNPGAARGLCDECDDLVGQWLDTLLACLTVVTLAWALADVMGWVD